MSPGADVGRQYFARYAEPEAALATAISGRYAAALVVPACREASALLDGYRAALARADGRVLVILVINAAEGAHDETHVQNLRLLSELALRFPARAPLVAPGVKTRAWLASSEHCDLVWLDRASSDALLPRGEGVGTARKVGGDLAALLWARGGIACSLIACTDADATLPSDYFQRLARAAAEPEPSAALLWPFQHEGGGDPAIDAATELYEISLRYYVLGLSAARSPYAYQSVGSSLCFDAAAYASARGFPKRAAAEDFYLLDKLAKVGPLRRASGAPLLLRARASDRVPFGTGRRTREIAELCARGQELELYAPKLFGALGLVIEGLNAFAACADPEALRSAVLSSASDLSHPILSVLSELKVFEALGAAAGQAKVGAPLRRRVHTWFDALRTLRFLHVLRDRCLPNLVWHEALAMAPFLREPLRDGSSPQAVSARLARSEAELPALVGPTL